MQCCGNLLPNSACSVIGDCTYQSLDCVHLSAPKHACRLQCHLVFSLIIRTCDDVQETAALIHSIQQDHMASEISLHKHLFRRFWDPVLTACSKLTSVCSNHSSTAVQHGRDSLSAIHDEAGTSSHLEDCRTAVDQLSAAELESARVSSIPTCALTPSVWYDTH